MDAQGRARSHHARRAVALPRKTSVSDATDRMIAAELTREQIVNQLHQELPYATAVETETWEDRPDGSTAIHQQILVERDSQKAIVIGKGGRGSRRSARRARRSPASRPAGAPVPARQGQPALGRGPRPLPRDRAGVGRVSPTSSRRRPAGRQWPQTRGRTSAD